MVIALEESRAARTTLATDVPGGLRLSPVVQVSDGQCLTEDGERNGVRGFGFTGGSSRR